MGGDQNEFALELVRDAAKSGKMGLFEELAFGYQFCQCFGKVTVEAWV